VAAGKLILLRPNTISPPSKKCGDGEKLEDGESHNLPAGYDKSGGIKPSDFTRAQIITGSVTHLPNSKPDFNLL